MENTLVPNIVTLAANQNINQIQEIDDSSHCPSPEDKARLRQLVDQHIQDMREGKLPKAVQENPNLKKLRVETVLKNYDEQWKYYEAQKKQYNLGVLKDCPYPPLHPMEMWENLPPYNPDDYRGGS